MRGSELQGDRDNHVGDCSRQHQSVAGAQGWYLALVPVRDVLLPSAIFTNLATLRTAPYVEYNVRPRDSARCIEPAKGVMCLIATLCIRPTVTKIELNVRFSY
jgi:hypothetical protein